MEDQEKHTMELVVTHASGAEEWVCPICGYRFVMQWPPAYKKIVLEQGNQEAVHSGGKGGVTMGANFVSGEDNWSELLNGIDFSKLDEDYNATVDD